MINIFISRPTWIAPEFDEGLSSFLAFLGTHEFKPRTLGSTDFATDSPLDEVIKIMDECQGVIVLGYPQIYVVKGKIKEIDKNDFHLPTEWNQIEATLAYFKKKPMLVIHHKGISRGVFDHGAINKFIYEKDLSKSTWFLSEDIIGALTKWKQSILQTKTEKSNVPNIVSVAHSSTHGAITGTPKIDIRQVNNRIDKGSESVLLFFFNTTNSNNRTIPGIMKNFKFNDQEALYHLEVLLDEKFIIYENETYLTDRYYKYYSLTSKGRQYVMTNKLTSN